MRTKHYLGDGVYAYYDGWHVILTTENGESITNTIYLEDEVLYNLLQYCARNNFMREQIQGVK